MYTIVLGNLFKIKQYFKIYLVENELMVAKGKGIVKEFGMDTYTLLCLKWIANKDLLYSIQNSAQC